MASSNGEYRETLTQEVRWHYRFRNFSRAYSLLREAFTREIEQLNDLEKEEVIKRFEFSLNSVGTL